MCTDIDAWVAKNKLLGLDLRLNYEKMLHIESGTVKTLKIPESIILMGIDKDFKCDTLIVQNNIGYRACDWASIIHKLVVQTNDTVELSEKAFSEVNSLQNLRFDFLSGDTSNIVFKISEGCFRDCWNLISVSFAKGSSVVVGKNAFEGCQSLGVLENFESLRYAYLTNSCFSGCWRLKNVIMPDIVDIESFAFAFCSGLEEVTFKEIKVSCGRCVGIFHDCSPDLVINLPKKYNDDTFLNKFGVSSDGERFKNFNFY